MRRACLILGVLVLAAIWLGPLLGDWRESFAAHMLAHMGVVAIAAPLLAVGFGGALAPIRRGGTPTPYPSPQGGGEIGNISRSHLMSAVGSGATTSIVLPSPLRGGVRGGGSETEFTSSTYVSTPLIASLVELIAVWGWHAPAARAWAETSMSATILEQASFLGAGLFLWLSALRPGREAAGALALLLTSIHMTLLGALIALSPRTLYGAGDVTCFGVVLSAGEDQQIGGVVMLMVGAAVYLAGGVALLGRLLGMGHPESASR